MKAIVITAPGKAALREVEPEALGPDDVRIRLLATGICGTDVEIFDGTMPYFTAGMAAYPVIPGHEWVGEVVEAGSRVAAFRPGDRVVGECSVGCLRCATCRAGDYHRCAERTETGILNRSGGFAELVTFPALFLHRIDASVPLESAAMVEPAAVAFNGVRRSGVTPRDHVAVFGDGPIGLLVAMMARACGAARVTVVGATPHRLALARSLVADSVVDINRTPDVAAALAGAAGPPTVAIEATGNPAAVESALASVAAGGRVVMLGLFAGKRSTNLDLDRVVIGEVTLRGALGSPGVWPDVIGLIERGVIDPRPLVSDTLPLAAFVDGIERVKARTGLKVMSRHDL
ncbi:MAG: alcohol dehydrogenase catalytic domain-containing protein [Rhizobiales bacterium]|nr:alcohol dehydrogenase catalytic domain-containing protein [Hyphomicrobiales bacterium]